MFWESGVEETPTSVQQTCERGCELLSAPQRLAKESIPRASHHASRRVYNGTYIVTIELCSEITDELGADIGAVTTTSNLIIN